MSGIPNLYDPYRANEELDQAANGLRSIYGPVAQRKAMFEQEQEQQQQSSGIDMQRLFQLGHQAVLGGADPATTATAIKLRAAGYIDDNHPIMQELLAGQPQPGAQAVPPGAGPAQQPQSGGATSPMTAAPGVAVTMQRPIPGPMPLPAGGGASSMTNAQPLPPNAAPAYANTTAAQDQNALMTPEERGQNTPHGPMLTQTLGMRPATPQPNMMLTNAERDFILKGGLRAIGIESPEEKLQRALTIQALKNQGGNERVAAAGNEARKTEADKEKDRENLEAAKQPNRLEVVGKKGQQQSDLQSQKDKEAWNRAVLRARTALATADKRIAYAEKSGLKDLPEYQEFKAAADKYRSATGVNAIVDKEGAEAARQDMEDKRQKFEAAVKGRQFGGKQSAKETGSATAAAPALPTSAAVAPPGGKAGGAMSAVRHVKLKDGRSGWLDAENNFTPDGAR